MCPLDSLRSPEPGSFVDGPFGSNLKTEHYTKDGPRVIRLENVGDGVFRDTETHVGLDHFERLRRHEARAGDVAIALLGDPVPRACVVPDRVGPAIVKADCPRLRPDPRLALPEFLAYALNSEQVRSQAKVLVHGVGRPRLRLSELRGLTISLPPLAEQRRIVEALETHFTRLDAAVATLQRVRANLKRYRAAILQAAVEGRLTGHVRGGAEPLIGWPKKTIADITTHLTSGSRDWSAYYGRGTATFLMAQNVRPGRLDLSFRQLVDPPRDDASRSRSQVHAGDLLVTIVGANTGNVCLVPHELPEHYVCQSVALMRPRENVLPQFLDYYLNSPLGQRQYAEFMYGAGRPHLSFEQLRSTMVSLPPLEEQRQIVAAADELLSDAAATEQSIDVSVVRIARLRQSLLRVAFDGHLVSQDPRDEPASVLLDRIRTARAAESSVPKRKPARSRR